MLVIPLRLIVKKQKKSNQSLELQCLLSSFFPFRRNEIPIFPPHLPSKTSKQKKNHPSSHKCSSANRLAQKGLQALLQLFITFFTSEEQENCLNTIYKTPKLMSFSAILIIQHWHSGRGYYLQ